MVAFPRCVSPINERLHDTIEASYSVLNDVKGHRSFFRCCQILFVWISVNKMLQIGYTFMFNYVKIYQHLQSEHNIRIISHFDVA